MIDPVHPARRHPGGPGLHTQRVKVVRRRGRNRQNRSTHVAVGIPHSWRGTPRRFEQNLQAIDASIIRCCDVYRGFAILPSDRGNLRAEYAQRSGWGGGEEGLRVLTLSGISMSAPRANSNTRHSLRPYQVARYSGVVPLGTYMSFCG